PLRRLLDGGAGWHLRCTFAPLGLRDCSRRVPWAHAHGKELWPLRGRPPRVVLLLMVNIQVRYAGNKKCDLTHPEGATIRTDAPKDIGGDASGFSPTDLVAAGLAACILTTIAMYAERHGLSVEGATASVEKHMITPPAPPPRRIGRLPV